MSTLVVCRKGNKAVIGSDSLFCHGSIRLPAAYKKNHHKIHAVGDAYIGFVGWAAMHNVFESVLERHREKLAFGSRRAIYGSLLALHEVLVDEYHIETREKNDQVLQSSQWDGLIVSPGGVFSFNSYREIEEYERFWADGSGLRFALGAMHCAYSRSDDPAVVAKAGLDAACEFDDGSANPCVLHQVELRG